MTQDERFLKSIHIVPDLAPVGKLTRETSAPFDANSDEPSERSMDTAHAMIDKLLAQPEPTQAHEPIPIFDVADAHPFSVTLDYAEWVAVVAAIQTVADQLQQARLRRMPTVETIALEVRLRMAENKITEASRTAK